MSHRAFATLVGGERGAERSLALLKFRWFLVISGPDLAVVAAHCGLSEKQVVELHSSVEYVVWFLGFQPGFPYLGSLPEQLHTPRRAEPRLLVWAGMSGSASIRLVYPLATPGGWQLIGHTSLSLLIRRVTNPSYYVRRRPCALYRRRRMC